MLVLVLHEAGDERAAHAVARLALRKDLSGRITKETRVVWEVAIPTRSASSSKHVHGGSGGGLRSGADARGERAGPEGSLWAGALELTQLMPSTAKSVARE